MGVINPTATGLKSATTIVNVSATTAPSAGQALLATDSTHATWGAAGGTVYFGRSFYTESIDAANVSGISGATFAYQAGGGFRIASGVLLNGEASGYYAVAGGNTWRANNFPLTTYGHIDLIASGLAASSAASTYYRFFSSSNDATSKVSDQVGIDLSKVNAAVVPKTSSGDGTTEQTTAISGVTYNSGTFHRYAFSYDGTTYSVYIDGVLKNSHSTNVPRRTTSIPVFYACIDSKVTSTDTYNIDVSDGYIAYPILG